MMRSLEDLPREVRRYTNVSGNEFVKCIEYEERLSITCWQTFAKRQNLWTLVCRELGNPLNLTAQLDSNRLTIRSRATERLSVCHSGLNFVEQVDRLFSYINSAHQLGWRFFDLAKKNLGIVDGDFAYFDWEPFERIHRLGSIRYCVTPPYLHPDDCSAGHVSELTDRVAALACGVAILNRRSSANEQFYRYKNEITEIARMPLSVQALQKAVKEKELIGA